MTALPAPDRPDDITAFAAERLAPCKKPAEIIIMDARPLTSTGKVLKAKPGRKAAGGA